MEDYLGLQVVRNAPFNGEKTEELNGRSVTVKWADGEVIEPGNFAIDKAVNREAFMEIFIHMLGFVADPSFSLEFNRNNRVYSTYNNLPRLYSPIGFKVTSERPIEKDGIPWKVLNATGNEIMVALKELAQIRFEGDALRIVQIRNSFDALMESEINKLRVHP